MHNKCGESSSDFIFRWKWLQKFPVCGHTHICACFEKGRLYFISDKRVWYLPDRLEKNTGEGTCHVYTQNPLAPISIKMSLLCTQSPQWWAIEKSCLRRVIFPFYNSMSKRFGSISTICLAFISITSNYKSSGATLSRITFLKNPSCRSWNEIRVYDICLFCVNVAVLDSLWSRMLVD